MHMQTYEYEKNGFSVHLCLLHFPKVFNFFTNNQHGQRKGSRDVYLVNLI